jgi:periplasmic protein TonB
MLDYNSNKVTLDDIVFEYRNKNYGAYLLRKMYDDHILKALLVAGLGFALAIAGPVLYDNLKPEPEAEVIEQIKEVKLAPPPPIDPKTPPPPPMPSSPPPPQVSTVKFLPPEVKPDELVKDEEPPKQEELVKAVASTETAKGDPEADPNQLVVEPGNGEGTVVAAPVEEEVFTVVEQQPTFPGGQDKMLEFLGKNIKYPYAATKAEIQGRVFVEFIVAPDGHLKDFKIVRGIGYGCDEEALRVAKMMPDWTPGKQAGRAVPVKLVIPVLYRLAN